MYDSASLVVLERRSREILEDSDRTLATDEGWFLNIEMLHSQLLL